MGVSPKLKIGLINSYYYPTKGGGSAIVVKTLAERLTKMGIDVFVIASDRKDSLENINGVRVYRLKHRNIYWGRESKSVNSVLKPIWHLISLENPILLNRVAHIVNFESPDVIHTHNIPSISYGVWKHIKKTGIPILHTLHDHALLCIRANMFKNGKNCKKQCGICKFFSFFKKGLHRYIDFVTAPSRYILEVHKQMGFFIKTPSKIIFNPLRFDPVGEASIKFKGKKLVFGFIGTLYRAKGIELLINIFNERKDLKLLIAGEAESVEYQKYLSSLINSPNIGFLGYIDSKEFFKKIDVLIVPSILNDVSPSVVPEAYAFGVPVVASNRGGLPELIEVGKTGEIFDISRPKTLCEILLKLESNREYLSKLSMGALKKAQEFKVDHIVDEYINIYECLKNSR